MSHHHHRTPAILAGPGDLVGGPEFDDCDGDCVDECDCADRRQNAIDDARVDAAEAAAGYDWG